MVAAAVVGSAAIGAVASSSASKSAANTQSKASDRAAQAQTDASEALRSDLAPYSSLGTGSIGALLQAMGYSSQVDEDGNLQGLTLNPNAALQKQFSFSANDLQSTPGYQFTLQQGLKNTNASLAAQGLGLSGAQARGLAGYTTGLADQTYNQQYNNALSTYNTNYQTASNNVNNLMSLLNIGQNSAAQTGNANINAANSAGGYLTQGANSQAAAQIAQGQAVGNVANSVQNAYLLNKLYG